jgi:hypothetical protein
MISAPTPVRRLRLQFLPDDLRPRYQRAEFPVRGLTAARHQTAVGARIEMLRCHMRQSGANALRHLLGRSTASVPASMTLTMKSRRARY